MATGTLFFACSLTDHTFGPAVKTTVDHAALPEAALAQVAQVRGYILKGGVEVTARCYTYGRLALKEVPEGKADFVTVAETPGRGRDHIGRTL